MKKHHRIASLGTLAVLSLVFGTNMAGAATLPVEDWVVIWDSPDGVDDAAGNIAAVTIGATPNSPVAEDSRRMAIGANFTPATLMSDGDFISLTGSVMFSTDIPSNHFRPGLYQKTVTPGDATGWVGYWSQIASNPGSATGKLFFANGLDTSGNPSTIPASGSTSVELAAVDGSIGTVLGDTLLNFGITVAKNGANANVSAFVNDGPGGIHDWAASVFGTPEVPASLTFDAVSLLMINFDPGMATFSDVNITTGNVPLNGDFDVDGDVDGADFLKWQRDLGDVPNLALWKTTFGTPAATAATASVPEPASLALVGIALALLVTRRRS